MEEKKQGGQENDKDSRESITMMDVLESPYVSRDGKILIFCRDGLAATEYQQRRFAVMCARKMLGLCEIVKDIIDYHVDWSEIKTAGNLAWAASWLMWAAYGRKDGLKGKAVAEEFQLETIREIMEGGDETC